MTMMGELDVTPSERSLINIQTNETTAAFTVGVAENKCEGGRNELKAEEREKGKGKVLSLMNDESTTVNDTEADLVIFSK